MNGILDAAVDELVDRRLARRSLPRAGPATRQPLPAPPRHRCTGRPHPEPVPTGRSSPPKNDEILDVLNSERFCDQAPAQIWATLLDEGTYLASISTMYRLLRAQHQVRERRAQARRPAHIKPELVATAPNQVWSWDITKLAGPHKWTWFQLYVILDVYSRYVVAWLVAPRESARLAEELIADVPIYEQTSPTANSPYTPTAAAR